MRYFGTSVICCLLLAVTACHGVKTHKIDKPFHRLGEEEKAALGNVQGIYEMGMAYTQGRDGAKNFELGTEWLCNAAKRGHVEAQYQVGAFYEREARKYPLSPSSDNIGNSSSPYDIIAYAWYNVAERNEHKKAKGAKLNVLNLLSQEASKQALMLSDRFPNMTCTYPPKRWNEEIIFHHLPHYEEF